MQSGRRRYAFFIPEAMNPAHPYATGSALYPSLCLRLEVLPSPRSWWALPLSPCLPYVMEVSCSRNPRTGTSQANFLQEGLDRCGDRSRAGASDYCHRLQGSKAFVWGIRACKGGWLHPNRLRFQSHCKTSPGVLIESRISVH